MKIGCFSVGVRFLSVGNCSFFLRISDIGCALLYLVLKKRIVTGHRLIIAINESESPWRYMGAKWAEITSKGK